MIAHFEQNKTNYFETFVKPAVKKLSPKVECVDFVTSWLKSEEKKWAAAKKKLLKRVSQEFQKKEKPLQ